MAEEQKPANAQPEEIKPQKPFWGTVKVILGILLLLLVVLDVISLTHSECIPPYLGIIFFALTSICFLCFLSLWAIRLTNQKVDELKSKTEPDCKYCGGTHSTGAYLCSTCNSIMWYKMKDESWRLPLAVFILEQRWQVFTAIFSVLLFIPGTYLLSEAKAKADKAQVEARIKADKEQIAAQLTADKEQLEAKNNSDALRNLMNDLNKVRAQIINLEANARDGKYEMSVFLDLNVTYTNIYWNHKSRFLHLLEDAKKSDTTFAHYLDSTKEVSKDDFLKHDPADFKYRIAYFLNKDSFDLSFVNDYMDYWNTVIEAQDNPSKRIERKKWANRLYHDLRITSLMYNLLIDREWLLKYNRYPLQNGPAEQYFDQIFKHYNGKVTAEAIYYLDFDYSVRTFIRLEKDPPCPRSEQERNYLPLPPEFNNTNGTPQPKK